MTEKNYIKLSLGRSALDRLFKDDPEIELQITTAAREQLAKTIMSTHVRKQIQAGIEDALLQLIGETATYRDKFDNYRDKFVLNEKAKRVLEDTFQLEVERCIRDCVTNSDLFKELREFVCAQIQEQTADLVRKQVAKVLNEQVKVIQGSL